MAKYLVSVETKNYQVNLTPIIQRYSKIKKYLSKSDIATCLLSNATVILFKFGSTIRLTRDNFIKQLSDYDAEQVGIEVANRSVKASEENKKEIEKLIEETNVPAADPDPITDTITDDNEGEGPEVAQADPEDPDIYDYSHFSDDD